MGYQKSDPSGTSINGWLANAKLTLYKKGQILYRHTATIYLFKDFVSADAVLNGNYQ